MSSRKSTTRVRILETTWRLMEQGSGEEVRMSDIADAAGVSRQAVYLHFSSRAELLVATTHHIDEVLNLKERTRRYESAESGLAKLEAFVEFWGNYIPRIHGLARVLLIARETDEAAATAWNDRMTAVREECQKIIRVLERDGLLSSSYPKEKAVDLLWTTLSVRNWEQLTLECGWTTEQYVRWMQAFLKRSLAETKKR